MRHRFFYAGLSGAAGFALMAIELLSSRIVAPFTGSTLYTWTSLIGMTLLGLATGSFIGGRLIDRRPHFKTLSATFVISAVLVALIITAAPLLEALTLNIPYALLLNIAASLLFLPPAAVIGALQPMIVRLAVRELPHIGEEYGFLSAAWSAGSILGVAAAGFVLIPFVGTLQSLALIALVLAACGAVVGGRRLATAATAIVLACVTTFPGMTSEGSGNVLYEDETAYYLAQVVEFDYRPFGLARVLFLDAGPHSIETERLSPSYIETAPLLSLLVSEPKRLLALGGGAYSFPRRFASRFPDANITVSEIDPKVTEIAGRFFGIPSGVETKTVDARVLLRRETERYDVIFGDAYNSSVAVPWHLTTVEFARLAKERLEPGGAYVLAFIGSFSGEGQKWTASMIDTFSAVFPNRLIVGLGDLYSGIPQNILLIGMNGPAPSAAQFRTMLEADPETRWLAKRVADDTPSGGIVLSDNRAPVELMLLPFASDYYADYYGGFYLRTL